MRDAYWMTKGQIHLLTRTLGSHVDYTHTVPQATIKSILSELGAYHARAQVRDAKTIAFLSTMSFEGERRFPIYLDDEERVFLLGHPQLPIDIAQALTL